MALSRSLDYIGEEAADWLENTTPAGGGCMSCHHVPMALWVQREAARAQMEHSWSRFDSLAPLDAFFDPLPGNDEGSTNGGPVRGAMLLLGRKAAVEGGISESDWQALAERVISTQAGDGSWPRHASLATQVRESGIETDAITANWIVLAVSSVTQSSAATVSARDLALTWLDSESTGESLEWWVSSLIVESELQAAGDALVLLQQIVIDLQQDDGGWGWVQGQASDSFSTGLALYGLLRTGLGADHDALHHGVQFLLDRQREDGSWKTPSVLSSQDPNDKKDYIYEFWGTTWATLALLRHSIATSEQP
ncbi:MAG: hypothetical protein ACPGU1_20445 [Myxococcota bacterium]